MSRARRVLPPLAIVGIGWLALVVYAYPGVMTMDSFDQLREGREWFFTDAHPPAMAALWGVVDRVVAGPFGMLVIQSAMFVTGVYLLACRAMQPRRAAFATCAIVLFPPVLAPMAVVWKDCQMAGFLVLGIVALLDNRRGVKLVGLAALTVATAMRYNAPAATLPLVVLLFDLGLARGWKRYAIGAGAWLVVTALAFGINALLVDRKMYFVYSSLAIQDIAGTLAYEDDDISDDELRPLLAPTGIRIDRDYQRTLRALYQPYDFQPLIDRVWDLPLNGTTPAPEPVRDAVAHAWWQITTTHKLAYLKHRASVFAEALGFSRRPVNQAVITHRAQYAGMLQYMHVDNGDSSVQRGAERVVVWFAKKTKLFRPHLYLIVSIALLFACRRNRDVLAIVLSGLAMELSLLPLVLTPDYRYSHWLVACTCIAVAILIARRATAPPPPSSAPFA